MPLTSADYIAKAVEMESQAEQLTLVRDSYLRMAAHWRELAQEAATLEATFIGPRPRNTPRA